MTKPCAVFWDIQNVGVPRGQSVESIVNLVRSTIIKPHNLNEIFFFCVCDVHKLPSNIDHSLTNLDLQAYDGMNDSADIKILDLMRKFVKLAGQDCAIILLSGDGDYYDTLCDLKKLYNVSIHLISLGIPFSPKLDKISDHTFMLNKNLLKLPMCFISIKNYPLDGDINYVMATLNNEIVESIQNSAILFDDTIFIGFYSMLKAERAIELYRLSHLAKAELIVDSPLAEILKCIKPGMTVQTTSNNEVKQLTFIKINNSKDLADISKVIKFFIACTEGIQCILSKKSTFWIVFSFESDAQKCLPKVQIMYPDAVISEPPNGLYYTCHENPYNIESCEQIITNEELRNVSIDRRDDSDCKIFFRYDHYFVAPMLYYQPTKWSLLHTLFEQMYDLGAKKVMFDGNLYCAAFDSVSAYQDAFEKIRSRYLEPLEYVNAPEIRIQEVTEKMNRYILGTPWCLNEELDLHCLVVKIESRFHDPFMETSKHILGNRECIFIKSMPDEIWIGFPDELVCQISKKTVLGYLSSDKQSNVSMVKPSTELLESINFRDLAGDAYVLAYLSSELKSSESIAIPRIIERISLERAIEKECNEVVFHITVTSNFAYWPWVKLSLEQVVKILVNFSKVIPVAATASYREVNLIFNTWHEAYAARHFINKLTRTEVPYFTNFYGSSQVKQQQLTLTSISEYYIINDNRKVLEKIMENKSLVDRLNSTSSTVESKSDIDILDEGMIKKLQYLFAISTKSGFKFTSEMISIIKINLVQMDCPVCIEFEDKIWVGVDDLEKGNKAKDIIEKLKFYLLHERDEDDFEVRVVMESNTTRSTNVVEMLANKLMNPTKKLTNKTYLNSNVVPLGHFNYNYRKAVGMSTSRYCQSIESLKS